MLVVNYESGMGWSTPEIKPYGPLVLDPMSSCLQYCTNAFEGMKVRIYIYIYINDCLVFLNLFTGLLGT